MKYVILVLIGISLVSCKKNDKAEIIHLMEEWSGREIVYPKSMQFVSLGGDTNCFAKKAFTIVSYVDSIGCTSCKLQLAQWGKIIKQLAPMNNSSVLFFLHLKNRSELISILQKDNFVHPVCIDEKDSFNILNKFPQKMMFQTFLLDKANKVVAIGNPIHNPKVKELYMNIISGEKIENEKEKTEIEVEITTMSLGHFDWNKEQKATFVLKNVGEIPLVIQDVITSCGCTTVEYSKEPARAGASLSLHVSYKADHPEHFNKTIIVYCNAQLSPIKLIISGDAE